MQHEDRTYEDMARENAELRQRVDDLDRQTLAMRISEDALKLDEARLEALLKLAQMSGASEQDVADFALEEAVRLTGSEVGWMGALEEGSSLVTLYNFSSGARQECGVVGRPHSFNLKNAGIWAQPIFRREPVILNDYPAPNPAKKGFPEGHMELRNFLAVPVSDDGRVVAVAEVGNKKTDYDWSDVRQLTLLMAGVWPIILRKRAEEALQQAKLQAELYVDLMGHDINNMNQIAIGSLELALQTLDMEKALTEKHRFLLEKPVDTLYNSARLIKNVKKLKNARAGGLAIKTIDLDEVLTSVRDEFRSVPGRDITIRYLPARGRYVLANELLRDVFSNIVGNAVKHSPPDRALVVGIDVLNVREQGVDYYVVSVEDNGEGITDLQKAELFSRLDSDDHKLLKSGLGLGLVKTLVDDFGGRVWVEDRVPGDCRQGSKFSVMIPACGG
jgi:two-component system, OmpR family, phosphate regulon sensor histidine kinase PhoR